MREKFDLTGKVFGRWKVLGKSHTNPLQGYWQCECDCGKIRDIFRSNLVRGKSTSCGCYRKEVSIARLIKHGDTRNGIVSTEFRIWYGILDRCLNKGNPAYRHYGGRGITVCERWLQFENFLTDMGRRPPGLSLDRRDNNSNYEPDNCRWATQQQQMRNTRCNRMIALNDRTATLTEWSECTGIKRETIAARLKRGYPVDRALSEPVRGTSL